MAIAERNAVANRDKSNTADGYGTRQRTRSYEVPAQLTGQWESPRDGHPPAGAAHEQLFDMKRAGDVMPELVPIDVISCDMDLYNDRPRRRWLSELNSGYPKLDWRSNADLVKEVARTARSVGRPVATPDQARKMLALK
jgi:beta-keto acid cleavage enzyme